MILVLASYQNAAAGTDEIFADGFEGNPATLAQNDEYAGSDDLVYEVCDATIFCATAEVNITIH